jgi:hypothetical protein
MTRLQAIVFAVLMTLVGGGTLTHTMLYLPPRQPDGSLDRPVFVLFLVGLLLVVTGIGALVALALHRRYPALAGASRNRAPAAAVGLRQGFLLGCALVAYLLLAFFQIFDVIFLLAIPLLGGLLEAYLQHRSPR